MNLGVALGGTLLAAVGAVVVVRPEVTFRLRHDDESLDGSAARKLRVEQVFGVAMLAVGFGVVVIGLS